MGTADVACVSGCKCVPVVLDGTWEKRASLQSILQFWVSPPRRLRGALPADGARAAVAGLRLAVMHTN